jgi:hypothetical protein
LGTGAVIGLLRLDGGRCGAEPTLRSQYRRKMAECLIGLSHNDCSCSVLLTPQMILLGVVEMVINSLVPGG